MGIRNTKYGLYFELKLYSQGLDYLAVKIAQTNIETVRLKGNYYPRPENCKIK